LSSGCHAILRDGPRDRIVGRKVYEEMMDFEFPRRRVLFLGLREAQMRSLAPLLRRRVVRAGELVCHRGQGKDALFLVERGGFELRAGGAVGARVIATFEPASQVIEGCAGDFFGEACLFGAALWRAEVRARERSVLIELRLVELQALFERDPELELLILRNVSRVLAARLRHRRREQAWRRAFGASRGASGCA